MHSKRDAKDAAKHLGHNSPGDDTSSRQNKKEDFSTHKRTGETSLAPKGKEGAQATTSRDHGLRSRPWCLVVRREQGH